MRELNTHQHWLDAAQGLRDRGEPYVLVTVLSQRGSTPRDSGSKMVFARDASFGSIGGGHLEYRAAEIAGELLADDSEGQRLEYFPLGPRVGQCCGGAVHLLFEAFRGEALNIAVFGAGHVGRALVPILAQLPAKLHWIDSRESFAGLAACENVERLHSSEPAEEVRDLPPDTYYVILTHNHQQDYDILRAVLDRADAAYVGLIGSETKWRRFRMRLAHQGYAETRWQAVRCPVGLAQVPGKLPVEVAVSIAAEVLAEYHRSQPAEDIAQGLGRAELAALAGELAETAGEE